MGPGDVDLAGFCVGVVERDRLLDGRDVRPGDAIIGLRSSGLHSNGFSLIRALLASHDLDLAVPYQEPLRRTLGEAAAVEALVGEPQNVLATLGDVLLTPTRVYARAVLALRDTLATAGHELGGLAHITGGGLPGNVARALPAGLGAKVDPERWRMPSVMRMFGDLAGMDPAEVRATFNGGLGMIAVVPSDALGLALATLADHGVAAALIGEVVTVEALDGARYLEGPLDVFAPAVTEAAMAASPARIAVGVSGAGSNLRALVAAARRGELGADVVLVFADRACPALDRAAEEGIDTALVPDGDDAALADVLAGAAPDLVVLAGYMRLVGPRVLRAVRGPDRQHPSEPAAGVPRPARRPRRPPCWCARDRLHGPCRHRRPR